jgi:hypothetical protein
LSRRKGGQVLSEGFDTALSPFTGFTRAHWEEFADNALISLRLYASEHNAQIRLPGPVSKFGVWSDALEAFARSFEMAAYRVSGSHWRDPHDLLSWYAKGIAKGVDPSSPERWPTVPERRQAWVEASSIAIGLHETREQLWSGLHARTQEQLIDWMSYMIGVRGHDNNHVWFQSTVQAFLKSVGVAVDDSDIQANRTAHERWYVGHGWYTDGGVNRAEMGEVEAWDSRGQNFDYYSGVLQWLPMWYYRILGQEPEDLLRTRMREYLTDTSLLFGSNGAPLFQGRSLTYRFSMLATLWSGLLFDATPLSPGETRRIASGTLSYFLDNGSVDSNGLLPIGWHGAFPLIRQTYSGAGSPYWAGKGMIGLLLDESSPVWTAPEEPMSIERQDTARSLRGPGWLVSATSADGIVRVANHGSDRLPDHHSAPDDPFYMRLAYSTHAAPDLGASQDSPIDSHVGLVDVTGRVSHRGRIDRIDQGSNHATSVARSIWPDSGGERTSSSARPALRTGPQIVIASVLRGPVEVRAVRIGARPIEHDDPDPQWPPHSGPWRLHVGGWAVAGRFEPPRIYTRPDCAIVETDTGLISAVRSLVGPSEHGATSNELTNPLGRFTATPWVRGRDDAEEGDLALVAIALTRRELFDDTMLEIGVTTNNSVLMVTWSDNDSSEIELAPLLGRE